MKIYLRIHGKQNRELFSLTLVSPDLWRKKKKAYYVISKVFHVNFLCPDTGIWKVTFQRKLTS